MDSPKTAGRSPVVPRLVWGAHVALVLLAGGFAALAAATGSDDANIGLGLSLGWLGLMGVPWTLPALRDTGLSFDSFPYVAAAVSGNLVNLALHALAWRWWTRRARRR